MRRALVIAAVALALSACARSDGGASPKPIPIEGDSISYEAGPCFGACPVYSLVIRPDGSGLFTGKRFTAVTGERAFKLTPGQYAAFAARLAPYRPASGEVRYAPGEKNCAQSATDMPGVDIRWTRAIGDSQALYFYFGCAMEKNRAMAQAIGGAPDTLPQLEALIGERP